MRSLWATVKYIFSVDFLKNLVVAAYWAKGGYTKTNVRGHSILITVDHWRVLKRAKTYSIKEPDTLDWIDDFEPGSCYFDIGANIGQYSLYPAKKYSSEVEICAFEPQSNNYYALNKNIFYNNLKDRISAYCIAVSGKTEFSKLYVPKFIPGGNRSQFGEESLAAMKRPASHIQGMFGATLDDLCGKWGFPYPNYLKIDVDGIEIAILKAAEQVLKHPNLKSVIVELGTPVEQQEAVAIMKQAGLELKKKSTRNWGRRVLCLRKIRFPGFFRFYQFSQTHEVTMKALFFLRHYNDIDHITPVISKWIERGYVCDIVMIGKKRFDGDYRIEFLKQLDGVRFAHLRDLLSFAEFTKWRLQTLLLVRSSYQSFLGPLVKLLAHVYNAKRREAIWLSTTWRLLERSFPDLGKGVVVFDWIERNSEICVEWVEILVGVARNQGLGTVSLPHGDSPHASQLIRRGEWQLKPDRSFSAAGMFDKVIVPNELCAKRFRPFMDDRKLTVLGSPRYCEEWLTKLATLMPSSPLVRSDSQLKIVIFLRKANFTTFWEEVEEVVQMIAAFPGVELAIKPHTRGGWKQSLTKSAALRRLKNVTMIEDGTHSVHLLAWADVIIDLATSVAYEAIRVGKPVLAADYLHTGRSAAALYMPETELRCRDDVYEKISEFLANGYQSYYIESHRQHFIEEMLDVPGQDVLSHYVALLELQAERK